ncbi:MAG: cell division protein ZapA [Clostridiales bacterium]|nr:cell division protein ZapA [Clostridiales bacterium]
MSDKVKTVVRIGGQEYRLSGYESEEYMHRVAIYVDRKMNEIAKQFTDLSTTMIAVLAALNIADELIRERSRNPQPDEPPEAGEYADRREVPPREAPTGPGSAREGKVRRDPPAENVAVLKKGRI